MSTVTALAALAALAGVVYRATGARRCGRVFRLEQFRPAAPLAGILDAGTGPGSGPAAAPAPPEQPRSSRPTLD